MPTSMADPMLATNTTDLAAKYFASSDSHHHGGSSHSKGSSSKGSSSDNINLGLIGGFKNFLEGASSGQSVNDAVFGPPQDSTFVIQDSDKPWNSLPGSLQREYPGQYKDSTWKEIKDAAKQGDKDAKKAKKLIQDGERIMDKIKSGGKRR